MAKEPGDRRMRALSQPLRPTPTMRLAWALETLPDKCPYQPVGYEGNTFYVIDGRNQLMALPDRELNRRRLISVCAPHFGWLREHYPRMRDGKKVEGIASESAADALVTACTVMGAWSPEHGTRGRGAWSGEDGDLVLHRGDHVVIKGRSMPPGLYGEYVYPARPALLPMAEPWQMEDMPEPGAALRDKLDSFAWSRGALDSLLMLGWIAAAMVAGALDFRPHVFVTGEFSAGKSTLQALLRAVFGGEGIISVSDSSAAGLWQAFGGDALPAGVDELEAETDPRRQGDVIKLIRQATSGGRLLRGGSDHHGVAFTLRSAFACSAIIMPPMPAQDASRFHVLHLLSIPAGTVTPPFDLTGMDLIGQALLYRMVKNYQRLRRDVLPAFKQRMLAAGYPGRAADLYGALLGCADVALHDAPDMAALDQWLGHRWMMSIRDAVLLDQTPEWQRCWAYLAASRIDPRNPASETMGELMARVVVAMTAFAGQRVLLDTGGDGLEADSEAAKAHGKLRGIGIRVALWQAPGDVPPALWIYVASQHRGLAEIFADTVWQTIPNAAGGGGWAHVLRRAPGATSGGEAVRFRPGVRMRAVRIAADVLLPSDAAEGGPPPPGAGEVVAEMRH